MKAYVHHDSLGAIHALLIVNSPEDRIATVAPGPGLFVAEVNADALGLPTEGGKPDIEALRKTIETLRVETPIPPCKLVSR